MKRRDYVLNKYSLAPKFSRILSHQFLNWNQITSVQVWKILHQSIDRTCKKTPLLTYSDELKKIYFWLYVFYFLKLNKNKFIRLDPWRVHHDANSSAHGLGWEVLAELGADGSSVTVGPGHLAPDDAEVGLLLLAGNGGLVLGLQLI